MFLRSLLFSVGLFVSSLSFAGFEEDLMAKADATTRAAYIQINKNWVYPDDTHQPVTAAGAWVEKSVQTQRGFISMLIWKPEVQPNLTQALDELFATEGLIMECSNAARLVRIHILCSLLGEIRTQELVRAVKAATTSDIHFMHTLSWKFVLPTPDETQAGIYCYPFLNSSFYPQFKPSGDQNCHNVVRLADGTYLGFYPEFFTQPRTYAELELHMFEAFKSDEHVDPAKAEAHKAICQTMGIDTFCRERKQHQSGQIFRVDLRKIQAFIDKGVSACKGF